MEERESEEAGSSLLITEEGSRMAATAVSPAPVTGIDMTDERIKASQVNAYRIAAVIDRLTLQLRNESKFDSVEFYNLCLSLARSLLC